MYLLEFDVSAAFNIITQVLERLLKSPLATQHVKEITIEQMISYLDDSFHQFSLQHEYDSFPAFIVTYLAKIRSKPNKQDLINVCQEFLHNWKRYIDKSCDLQLFLYCSVIQMDNQKKLIELFCFIRKNLFSYQTNLYRSSPLDSLQYGFDEANRLFQLVFSADLRTSIGDRFVAIIQKHSKKIYKGEILKGNFIAEYVLHEYLEILMKTPRLLNEIIFNAKQKHNADRQSNYSFRQMYSAREGTVDSPDKKKKKETPSQQLQQPTLDLQVLDDKPLKVDIPITRIHNSVKKNGSPIKINELINGSTQKNDSFGMIQVSAVLLDGNYSKKSNQQIINSPEQNGMKKLQKDVNSRSYEKNKLKISQQLQQNTISSTQQRQDEENKNNSNHLQAPPDSPEFALNQAITHGEYENDDSANSNSRQSFHLDSIIPILTISDKPVISKNSSMSQTTPNKIYTNQQKDNQLTVTVPVSLGQVVQSISGIAAEDYSSSLNNQSINHLSFNNINTQYSSIHTQSDNINNHNNYNSSTLIKDQVTNSDSKRALTPPRSILAIDPHPDTPKHYGVLNTLSSPFKGNIENESQIQQERQEGLQLIQVDVDSKPIVKRSSNRAATLLSPPKKEEHQASNEKTFVSQAGISYSAMNILNLSVDQNLLNKDTTPQRKDAQVLKQQLELKQQESQQQPKEQQQQQQKQNESDILKTPEKQPPQNQQELLITTRQIEIEQSKISGQQKQLITSQQSPMILLTQVQTAKTPSVAQSQMSIIPGDQVFLQADSKNKGSSKSSNTIQSQQQNTKNIENNKQKQTLNILSSGQVQQEQASLLQNNNSSDNNNKNNNNNVTALQFSKINESQLGSSFIQQTTMKQVDQTKIVVNPGNIRQCEEDGIEFESKTWLKDTKEASQRVSNNQQASSLLNAKMIPIKQNQNSTAAQPESLYTNERLCLSFSKQ